MKTVHFIAGVVGLCLAAVVLTGCGKSEQPPTRPVPPATMVRPPVPPGPLAPPTPPGMPSPMAPVPPGTPPAAMLPPPMPPPAELLGTLTKAFADSDNATRGSVDQALAAMRVAQYNKALPLLQQLLANAQLTTDQQQAVNTSVAWCRQQLAARAMADPRMMPPGLPPPPSPVPPPPPRQ